MHIWGVFHEILATINNNRLRTILTGFAVAWGILLLILLLASGKGLRNGVMSNFAGRAQNSVSIWPGKTSVDYAGFTSGREIKFTPKDIDLIENHLEEVTAVAPRIIEPAILSYGEESGIWNLEGTNLNIVDINDIRMKEGYGRFLNELDIKEKRKVIVISEDIRKLLFKNEDPIGKPIVANRITYEVVGVYDRSNSYQLVLPAYVPISIAKMLYSKDVECHKIDFIVEGLDSHEANDNFNKKLRKMFGQIHNVDPEDRAALFIRNTSSASIQAIQIFRLIDIFIFIVGLASLIAGSVGVGNIMLITIKERTVEIGIRKALGAKPKDILWLIIMESIFITSIAGYIGLLIGIGITELANRQLANTSGGVSMFKDPSVDIGTMVVAIIIIIICGIVAGLMPALKASKISPIDAMRNE